MEVQRKNLCTHEESPLKEDFRGGSQEPIHHAPWCDDDVLRCQEDVLVAENEEGHN